MNDYKELIEHIQGDAAFRHIISECGADGKVWFDKRFICDYVSHLKYAIEQLVRERNAIAYDLSGFRDCSSCRHAMKYAGDCADLSECKWEWRGVQNEQIQ